MAEFFIVNRWRRRGVGLSFARQLLARFPGPWKLHELANNTGAIAFWHRVLGGFAPYTEAPLAHADGIGPHRAALRRILGQFDRLYGRQTELKGGLQ